MKIILLGAPGAGKGTQAAAISGKYQIPVLGTGNLIRTAMQESLPAGEAARSYMERGLLVPDEIVLELLIDRMSQPDCENGYILDGFPRTVIQAEQLEKMGVEIDRVIDIEVSDETIIKRMSGRRICESCGAIYHIEHQPPQKEGVCDVCEELLIVRSDDEPQTVLERLEVYHEQTEPLKQFYQDKDKLSIVQGQEKVEDTTNLTMAVIEALL